MSNQRRSKQTAPSAGAAAPQAESRMTIQLADEARQRREAEQERNKLLKRLRNAEKTLARFREEDRPQYDEWKEAEFGERLRQLQQLEAQVEEQAHLIEEVEDAAFFTGLSYGECYERIQYAREHPEEFSTPDADPFVDEDDDDDDWDDELEFEADDGFEDEWFGQTGSATGNGGPPTPEEMEEEFHRFLAEVFGIKANMNDPLFQEGFKTFKRQRGYVDMPSATRPSSASPGLKKLYRALARRLHPDHREELAPEIAGRLDALWHETQEAYRHGNGEELQRIEALIDLEIHGVTERTPLERIRQATDRDREVLRAVEREVRQARKTPAWMFSKKKSARSAELRRLFEDEIQEISAVYARELAKLKQRIAGWARSTAKRAQRAARAKNGRAAAKATTAPDSARSGEASKQTELPL